MQLAQVGLACTAAATGRERVPAPPAKSDTPATGSQIEKPGLTPIVLAPCADAATTAAHSAVAIATTLTCFIGCLPLRPSVAGRSPAAR